MQNIPIAFEKKRVESDDSPEGRSEIGFPSLSSRRLVNEKGWRREPARAEKAAALPRHTPQINDFSSLEATAHISPDEDPLSLGVPDARG